MAGSKACTARSHGLRTKSQGLSEVVGQRILWLEEEQMQECGEGGGRWRAQARTCFTVATVSGRACFSACCSSVAPRPGIGVPPPGIVEPSATRPSVSKKELSSRRNSAPLQAAAGISRWGDILQTLRLSCDQSSLLVLSIRSMRRQLGPADAWRRLYRDSISHLRPKSGRECEPRPHPSSCRP